MTRELRFPDGFQWGAATAAHQNEGDNDGNDFWAWEQTPGHIADGTTSGLACDWWRAAEDDFDRAAALNLNSLRLSIEWSRLEPEPDRFDDDAFGRYREMLTALHQRGIEPMVTLHHFTNPLWLAEVGGWADARTVMRFWRFTRRVLSELGDLCRQWCTINEPNVYAVFAFLAGTWTPGRKELLTTLQVMRHLAQGHAAAYHAIRRAQPDSEVGFSQHLATFTPADPNSFFDRKVARLRSTLFNQRLLDAVIDGRFRFPLGLGRRREDLADSFDFLGVNYYGRHWVEFDRRGRETMYTREVPAPAATAWAPPWGDREIHAEGLRRWILDLHRRTGKPVYVTENGLADTEDERRPAFLLTHLAAIHRAIADGADVRGYYHWTLVDNYEWVEGWIPRFGLIGLDPHTQERHSRPSAQLFAEIAASNAIDAATVERFAPEVMDQIFDSASL